MWWKTHRKMMKEMKSTERRAAATQLRTSHNNNYNDKHWSTEHVYKIIIIIIKKLQI
jgi:hypothetical protein